MVDAFRLSTTQNDAAGIMSGILDGLAELVRLDAAGVYIVDAAGRKLLRSLVRGCDLPVPKLEAPFEGQGVVARCWPRAARCAWTPMRRKPPRGAAAPVPGWWCPSWVRRAGCSARWTSGPTSPAATTRTRRTC